MVVGNETQVGEPLLGMSQGNFLVPDCLVLGGGLQGGGRGHSREVLAGGSGLLRGRGTWPIQMGEGGGHSPGRGQLCPFVKVRGMGRQPWWPVRCGRVWLGLVCGLGVWVCRRADRDVVLCGRDGVEIGARAEHVCRGGNCNVMLLHGRVAFCEGRQGCCQVESRGVALGQEVDSVPVRVVRLGRGDSGESLV